MQAITACMKPIAFCRQPHRAGMHGEVHLIAHRRFVFSGESQRAPNHLGGHPSHRKPRGSRRKLGISPRTLRYKLAQLRERGMDLAIAA